MIDKSMIVDDVLYNHPRTERVFKDFGIKCFGWGGVLYMSVGQAALRYRINPDELIEKLNAVIAEAEKKA